MIRTFGAQRPVPSLFALIVSEWRGADGRCPGENDRQWDLAALRGRLTYYLRTYDGRGQLVACRTDGEDSIFYCDYFERDADGRYERWLEPCLGSVRNAQVQVEPVRERTRADADWTANWPVGE